MPTIKFVRVERDSEANRNARAAAAQVGTTPRLTYDFHVLIDGERRAEMRREVSGKGYYVRDADGRPIDPPAPYRHDGRKVDSKAEFLSIVTELLDAGKIPTPAEMAAKRKAEEQARLAAIQDKKAGQRLRIIRYHAEALYDALKATVTEDAVASARELLNVVDADVAEQVAAVDSNPDAFGIY